jgi:alkanesulfonate monooxygenase SsuD/methylene tetrahydromethanopterin reductase-like flavin-dependent oxidoreductase (luciferase family)
MMGAIEWNLQCARWSDELGFAEYWMGEHFTEPWEPVPAPDLVIAQAINQTTNVKLGPAGHCLPFHHPVALAYRVAQLDHMAKGRYQFGIASGSILTDLAMYGLDPKEGLHRKMLAESLDIILKVWASEPGEEWSYDGEFWKVHFPKPVGISGWHHIKPLQLPHPPIAVTGMTPNSGTLRVAGARGFIPMSMNMSKRFIATHWSAIEEGAASTGRTPRRADWRVLKQIFVADTDAEARHIAIDGPMGQMMREYTIPLGKHLGIIQYYKDDPDMSDDDLTVEWFVDKVWLVGSPETVREKLEEMYNYMGGFGYLMVLGYHFADIPEAWRNSLGLLAEEVMPKLSHLTGD